MLEAAVDQPEGVIQDTLYPVVHPETIRDIIKEMKKNKREYKEKIYTKMHTSYGGHYRQPLSNILKHLEFRSNNQTHQPVIEAIQLIRGYENSGQSYFAITDEVPIEGVIQSKWKDIIIETDSKEVQRINRVKYEIAVLQSLRSRLRCKEIWIVGADRYRNPEEIYLKILKNTRKSIFRRLKYRSM